MATGQITGQVNALLQEVKGFAADGVITLQEIERGFNFATNMVRVDAVQALDHGNGHGTDPVIDFSIPGFTFHANVDLSAPQAIADVGMMAFGAAMIAAGAESGGVSILPGAALFAVGASDLYNHIDLGISTAPLINGQNILSPDNTALPPVAFDGTEREPDGDSDDAFFVGAAINQLNIAGLDTYLHGTFLF